MAVTLPKYVVLQSAYNHKYLQFLNQEGELHGFLNGMGNDVVSPYTKFEVQVSEADKTLVHLRSCYNNKYWVPSTDVENWVLADANEPEEDRTKLSCTLFKPECTGDDPKSVRFMHVNSKKYVTLDVRPTLRNACMYLDPDPNSHVLHKVFSAIDWSSLVIFPRYVAVKGGAGGKYLSALPLSGERYLQFVADDLSDETVGQEVFPSGAGHISVKSQHYDKFWTQVGQFVLADTECFDTRNENILFSPTPPKGNVFQLWNLAYNDVCRSVDIPTSGNNKVPVLGADNIPNPLSDLEVVDRATSWVVTVDEPDIHVSDARITVPTPVVLAVSDEVVNDTDSDVDVAVTLSYVAVSATYTLSSTANGSLKVGVTPVTATILIPFEVCGIIIFKFPLITRKVIWGVEEKESHDTTQSIYTVTVPARCKATVKVLGQKRLWDVPFSYDQEITLSDGTVPRNKMDDGIYTGTETHFTGFGVETSPIN